MQMPLFPVDDLTIEAPVAEAVAPEPEPIPLLPAIPGQLDLFTGEEAA